MNAFRALGRVHGKRNFAESIITHVNTNVLGMQSRRSRTGVRFGFDALDWQIWKRNVFNPADDFFLSQRNLPK